MKSMRAIKRLLPVAIAAATVATPALSEGLNASLTVSSNKVWRGITRTDNEAAVEASVHYQHETGVYAGTSISNVNSVRPLLFGTPPSSETDLFIGYTGGFDEFGWDVGYQYYLYTDTPDSNIARNIEGIDFGEIYLSLSYDIVSAGIAWTTNSQNGNDRSRGSGRFHKNDLYYWASIGGAIADGWGLTGTVGYYAFDLDGKIPLSGIKVEDYVHYQVDLTKEAGAFGDVTLSLAYATDNAQEYANSNIFNADDEKVIMFVSWNKIF